MFTEKAVPSLEQRVGGALAAPANPGPPGWLLPPCGQVERRFLRAVDAEAPAEPQLKKIKRLIAINKAHLNASE